MVIVASGVGRRRSAGAVAAVHAAGAHKIGGAIVRRVKRVRGGVRVEECGGDGSPNDTGSGGGGRCDNCTS